MHEILDLSFPGEEFIILELRHYTACLGACFLRALDIKLVVLKNCNCTGAFSVGLWPTRANLL